MHYTIYGGEERLNCLSSLSRSFKAYSIFALSSKFHLVLFQTVSDRCLWILLPRHYKPRAFLCIFHVQDVPPMTKFEYPSSSSFNPSNVFFLMSKRKLDKSHWWYTKTIIYNANHHWLNISWVILYQDIFSYSNCNLFGEVQILCSLYSIYNTEFWAYNFTILHAIYLQTRWFNMLTAVGG